MVDTKKYISTGSKEEQREARRKRRASMSIEEKLAEFFSCLSQLCAFLFGGFGAYAFAHFLERVGCPDVLSSILGLVFFCLVVIGVFSAPKAAQKRTEAELADVNRYAANLEEAIQSAIIGETTTLLYPCCDPAWLHHVQETKREAQDRRAYQEYVEGLSQSAPPDKTESPQA